MEYNIEESKEYLLGFLGKRNMKHAVNDFPSGCSMIDIWNGDKFWVIQLEPDSIGLSLVTEELDLSTIPDERFYDFQKFLNRFFEVLDQ